MNRNTAIGPWALCIFFSTALCAGKPAAPPDAWQAFLHKYLDTASSDGIHRIRYAAVTEPDRKALSAYLQGLQSEKLSALARDRQRAFWINLYNARTLAVVLEKFPVKSIVDVKLPGSPNGPWDAKLLHVEGRDLSLNEIENSILRPGWKDPRIHFALNCASLGCPDLAGEAFTAENSERLLEEGARAFIASPRGAEFSGDTLRLSSIFDWYKTDFGKSPGDLLAWLASHAPKEKAARLKAHTGKIIYRYDWALNAKP